MPRIGRFLLRRPWVALLLVAIILISFNWSNMINLMLPSDSHTRKVPMRPALLA